ncbi:MAG: phage holin family protein [Bacteroidota bacterium]
MEENKEDFFAESKKELEQYVRDRIWLLKLQAGEKAAQLMAVLFFVVVIGLLAFFVLLFLSIMAGYYFADLTGSLFTGFAIVAAFYVLLLAILILARKRIEKIVINTVIQILFAKSDKDHEE